MRNTWKSIRRQRKKESEGADIRACISAFLVVKY